MTNKEPGNVYTLTYPCFRDDWVKIGKNGRPMDMRSTESNKELILPFLAQGSQPPCAK